MILGSTIRRIDLEAEESSIVVMSEERKFNGQSKRIMVKLKDERVKCYVIKSAEILGSTRLKEFNTWNVYVITISRAMLWDILNEVVDSRGKIGEQKCLILIKFIDHGLALNEQKLDMEEDFGCVYTEGGRKDSMYGFNTTEDEGRPLNGLGYNTLLTGNNQKVLGGRICWSRHLGSAVLGIGLEAEESSIIMISRRREFNRQVVMIVEKSKEQYFEYILSELMNFLN
jgi:hypothetical protein